MEGITNMFNNNDNLNKLKFNKKYHNLEMETSYFIFLAFIHILDIFIQ